MTVSTPSLSADELARRDALTGRLFEATLGAWDLLAAQLGLELGFYQALTDHGAMTAPQLAKSTGTDARYAREWLEQQAATGILEVDDATAEPDVRRFTLPAGHAEALLDPDSLGTAAPMTRAVGAAGLMLPAIAAAYRTGEGVEWPVYPGLIEAQELANRPVFRHLLTQEWLPAIPDIHARLQTGGRVADVATGTGWSAIAMAAGYPNSRVDGLDIDADRSPRRVPTPPAKVRTTRGSDSISSTPDGTISMAATTWSRSSRRSTTCRVRSRCSRPPGASSPPVAPSS